MTNMLSFLWTRLPAISSSDSLPQGMFNEVMNDLWLARISSLSNEVGLYVVLLEVLLFMQYCETVYSRSGINHMWILKNSKDQDLSVRYPPSKLLIFQLNIPPYRMTN
jgi:hypothetical protein